MSIFPFMFLDKEPPFYRNTCLRNMVFHAPGKCAASAVVSWKEPIATDNSGHVTFSYPALRPPANLSIGLHYVHYSAADDEGNRANCTLVVQVVSMSQIQYFTEICYVRLSLQSLIFYILRVFIFKILLSFSLMLSLTTLIVIYTS